MEEYYMKLAVEEAKKAYKCGEMPVGAVIVKNNKVIGKGYNKKEITNQATMHAEIIAINQACKKNKNWRLNECTLYVTLEPCVMCMGAIIESRIKNVYCGVTNNKTNKYNLQLCQNENIDMKYGILQDEVIKQINDFFVQIRK